MTLFCKLRRGSLIMLGLLMLTGTQALAEAESEVPAEEEISTEKIESEISIEAPGPVFEGLEAASNVEFGMEIACEDDDLKDGLDWKLHFENRTDADMSVSFSNTAINGWMCPTDQWSVTGWSLTPGEAVDAEVSWTAEELERINVTSLNEIAFSLKAYAAEKGSYKYYANSVCRVGFGTEDAEGPKLPEEKEKIMDTTDYAFSILDYGTDEDDMPLWTVYLENKTSDTVLFELKDCVLNGFASDPYWSTIVLPGYKSLTQISWWNLDLEEAGIRKIHDASFKVRVWKEAQTGFNSFVDPVEETAQVKTGEEEDETENGYKPSDTDIVLYDENDIGMGITRIGYSDDLSYYIISLYLSNNSEKDIKAEITDILVNGKDTYSDWSREVGAGTWLTGTISLDRATLEKMKVNDVRTVSLSALLTDKSGNKIAQETYEIDAVKENANKPAADEEETEETITLTEETEETITLTEETEETITLTEETEEDTEEAAETETQALSEITFEVPAEAVTEEQTEAATEAASEAPAEETEEETEPVTLPAAETEAPAETEPEKTDTVFTDEKTVRMVQSALIKAGYDLEKDGKIGNAVKEAISKFRSENSLGEGTDITQDLLTKMGITDSATMQKIQEKLNALGYDCGEPDGLSGRKTNEAIEAYRSKENIAGEGIDAELISHLGINEEAAETEETEAETEEAETAEAETEKAGTEEQEGFTDEKTVRMVQNVLNDNGADLEKDGKLGKLVKEAIEIYRETRGLSAGTAIDDELLFDMGIIDSATMQKIQEKLNGMGYDCGEPDGLTGKKTKAAIEEYKKKENLEGTGIDQKLLESLGISR